MQMRLGGEKWKKKFDLGEKSTNPLSEGPPLIEWRNYSPRRSHRPKVGGGGLGGPMKLRI